VAACLCVDANCAKIVEASNDFGRIFAPIAIRQGSSAAGGSDPPVGAERVRNVAATPSQERVLDVSC